MEWHDVNRLVALFKGTLSHEIEALGELRPFLQRKPSNGHQPQTSPTKMEPNSSSINNNNSLSLSLPLLSRYLLIAAYLASSNPARKDLLMLATGEDELHKLKKKKGGATRKTPSSTNRLGKDGLVRKEVLPQRLLGPKPFPLERMVAVCECILPVELRGLTRSCDLLQEVRRFLTYLSLFSIADKTM